MKPPSNRYSTSGKSTNTRVAKAKDPRLPIRQRRAVSKEVRKFTRESVFKKYFVRSLLASLLALILLVLATMFTPLMSVDKIAVTGNQKVATKEIEAAVKHRIGTALPMLSESDIAADLAKFKLIESIALISKPPHSLEVRITERTPISIVVRGSSRYLYDPAGVNLGLATGYEKLPTIIIKDDPKTSKNYRQAIDVLLALPAQLLDRVAYIQAKSRDNVTMQLRGYAAQTIIWGDSTDSMLKSQVLKALLLKTSPKVRATFDVSSPLTPSVIK